MFLAPTITSAALLRAARACPVLRTRDHATPDETIRACRVQLPSQNALAYKTLSRCRSVCSHQADSPQPLATQPRPRGRCRPSLWPHPYQRSRHGCRNPQPPQSERLPRPVQCPRRDLHRAAPVMDISKEPGTADLHASTDDSLRPDKCAERSVGAHLFGRLIAQSPFLPPWASTATQRVLPAYLSGPR